MAKGDAMGGGAAQAPKMDQYSVMHRIFDHLGGQNKGIAPQGMPGMQSSMNMGNKPMPRDLMGNGMGPDMTPNGQIDFGGGRTTGTGPRFNTPMQFENNAGAMNPNFDIGSLLQMLQDPNRVR